MGYLCRGKHGAEGARSRYRFVGMCDGFLWAIGKEGEDCGNRCRGERWDI